MFASRITKDVDVQDGDAIVVVTVQRLSGRSLQKAREARSAASLTQLRGASPDMLAFFRGSPSEQEAEIAKVKAKQAAEAKDLEARRKARFAEYDRDHVLEAGIVRWTSKEELNNKSIGDLDEDASQKLHEAILDLSLPPLDPAVAEAELGKG